MFVGRAPELARCLEALDGRPEPRLLYVQGPAGIGKTELLHTLSRKAKIAGYRVGWLDGSAAQNHLEVIEQSFATLARSGEGPYLQIIDELESFTEIERWLRTDFLPRLSGSWCLAFASRLKLAADWRMDPGWSRCIEVIEPAPFSQPESEQYLERRGIPQTLRAEIHSLSGGHPLCLALLSDVSSEGSRPPVRLEGHVLHQLVERFTSRAPTPRHRRALVALSIARHLSQDLLEWMLDCEDAAHEFSWLARLTFVDSSPAGLVSHARTRLLIREDAKWRTPEDHALLLSRALAYSAEHVPQPRHWDDPVKRSDWEYLLFQGIRAVEPATQVEDYVFAKVGPGDRHRIESMILRFEGKSAVELFRFWDERGSETIQIVDHQGDCAGFLCYLRLDRIPRNEAARDPLVYTLWRHLHSAGVLAHGGPVFYGRFLMAESSYHDPSPVLTLIWTHIGNRVLATPDIAYVGHCMLEPERRWTAGVLPSAPRAHEGIEVVVGGRRYGVVGKDLRDTDGQRWAASLMNELAQMLAGTATLPTRALDHGSFTRAVKEALRVVDRPDLLQGSLLLATGLVDDADGPSKLDRAHALAERLRHEAKRFLQSPKDERYYRVLERAFFEPASKHEAAAAELGMGYSTFRRHLKTAIDRMTTWLWQALLQAEHEPSTK